MADENTTAANQAEEAINPAPTSETPATDQVQSQENQQEEPQYVTRKDLDGFATEILRRAKQSDRDRNKQINDELDKIKNVLEKAGTPVSPAQEAALRNTITDQLDAEEEPQPTGQSAARPEIDPVDKFLGGIFAETGEEVTPNDPEWQDLKKVLDDNFNNPNGLAKVTMAATKAATAKKERKASMQDTATARVGGGGDRQPAGPVDGSGRDQLEKAFGS